MKSLHIWIHPQREWQIKAYQAVIEKYDTGKKDFLCEATPGGGKTRFALRVAHKFLQMGYSNRIVIVVPTEHLKKQWAEDANNYSIDLDPNLDNEKGKESGEFHGAVLTYAQIGLNPMAHKMRVNNKTFVIFDEVHHAGDGLTWGDALLTAFEDAGFRLSLSGTPFRHDDNPIPFVIYKDGISMNDFAYSYKQAIIDGVCRPVNIPAYDGIMKWKVDNQSYDYSFKDMVDDVKASERLRTALNPEGEFLRHMIIDANKRLLAIRNEENHAGAGGLIFAIDQEHARGIANLISNITREDPEIVISDDKESSKRIKQFKNSNSKWLVSVKMVSEGVDIPRLRVGVFATNVTKEKFFRQAVGRFTRMVNFLESQDGYLFIPADPRLMKVAIKIEEERKHALNNGEKFKKDIIKREPAENIKQYEAISSIVTDKVQLELNLGNKIENMFGLPAKYADKITEAAATQINNDNNIPVFIHKKNLREEINNLSKIIARQNSSGNDIDWSYAHKRYAEAGGRSIEVESLIELEKRKDFYLKLL